MQTIMLLNPKGGCGKTTIATNLAAYYAGQGFLTALFDHDAQGSSTRWLEMRPESRAAIHGVAAFQNPIGVTRSFQLRVPLNAERVIVDTPAGLADPHLPNLVRTADTIIVPVLPSPIDIDAVLSLVEALRRVETVCKYGVRIAAVVNRVPAYRSGLKPLEMALETVGLSVATRLRETRRYPRASARGIGVNELGGIGRERCLDDWRPLWAWLENGKGHEALTPEHQSRPRLFPDRVAAPA
ncbi:MAG: AAA family ATPase [Gammaproteobacteria bacterium]|nr:AAA family ATPase [Gammaproteobacteria bacterium]NIO26722.1 AAA family ATPase [Gammaproteobacteria bacterium]NIO67278.1 AAA family ATPase [Gammaproteobacteria bacterium]NIP48328.1 ParA family protein [Gammaproteobacteria bacterium]NIP64485.1 AAA family ATPase [Gammaproteobacteria bacterium]